MEHDEYLAAMAKIDAEMDAEFQAHDAQVRKREAEHWRRSTLWMNGMMSTEDANKPFEV